MKAVVFAFISLFCLSASEQILSQRRRHVPSVYNGTTLGHPATSNGLLDRVYDKVTALTTLDEQQLKRLEALEYKMTRLEVTNQERLDNLREELKEISRRNQNLDWLVTKSDGTLDQLRSDLEAIRQNLDTTAFRSQPSVQQPSNDLDCAEKLTAVATLLTSTRAAVHKIENAVDFIGQNLTQLLTSTREVNQRQHSFPTKQYLNSALHSIRSQPVYALLNSGASNHVSEPSTIPNSCSSSAITQSGVYKIQVHSGNEPFFAMCDSETEGGGWTIIQQRKDGSVTFYRHWLEYKLGFGNIAGEFFIGLDRLHDITMTTVHELLILLEDFEGEKKHAKYSMFAIGGEKEDYALNLLGEYEGTAGDSLSYSASYKFSTFDNDNDGWVEGNCAQAHTGAWWYNACEMSNLNGQYLGGEVLDNHQFQGIYWNEFRGPKYALKSVKMMIRPVDRIDRIFGPDMN